MIDAERTVRSNRNVTRADVAQEAGVSLETVAYALNNHPRVSPKTRERIVEAANRLGFVANAAARRLVRLRGQSRAISFEQAGLIYLVSSQSDLDPSFLLMLTGIEQELSKINASLTLVRVAEPADWDKVRRLTRLGSIDGWMIVGAVTDAARAQLKETRLPFVVIGDHRCTKSVPNVNVDHAAAASMAVHHLASLGHRRIAFLAGSMAHVYQMQMLEGYRAAMRELGLDDEKLIAPLEALWIIGSGDSGTSGVSGGPPWVITKQQKAKRVKLMRRWLDAFAVKPTAMFTQEFGWSAQILDVLHSLGLRVPQDMNLIGYESESKLIREQGLTHIASPMADVGRHGVMLLHRIVTQSQVETCDMKIMPQLVEGWSTGEVHPASSHGNTSHLRSSAI